LVYSLLKIKNNKKPQKATHTVKRAKCSLRASISTYKNSVTSTPRHAAMIELWKAVCLVWLPKGQHKKRDHSQSTAPFATLFS